MTKQYVTPSKKYQAIIPKETRKRVGLLKPTRQLFSINKVTENKIVFRKTKSLDDFLGKHSNSFAPKASAKLRSIRDTEWEC